MLKQHRVASWWRQRTCVGGTCAAAAAPPRTTFARALDAYTSLTAPFVRGCLLLPLLAVVVLISFRIGQPGGPSLSTASFLVHGSYYLANFVRCREAHCIVTGHDILRVQGRFR